MSKENQEIEEIVENEQEIDIVEKKKVSKGAIIAAVTAAGVGIAGGVAWLYNKLKKSSLDYVDIDEDDDYIEEDSLEIEVSEE